MLRWLTTPLAAIAIALGAFAVARWLVQLADRRCAVENMIGGACVEPWHTGVVEQTIFGAVMLAALAIAVVPALIAPSGRRIVSTLCWLVTTALLATAYWLSGWQDLLPVALAGSATGLLGLAWIYFTYRGHLHAHASR